MKKDNIHSVQLDGVTLGQDFTIVSKVELNEDFEVVPVANGMPTPFNYDVVRYVYYIDNHEIDVELAVALGLGVIEDVDTGFRYLYNCDVERDEFTTEHEMLKLGIYYQITFPEYHDKKLDDFINETPKGKEYLRMIIHADFPISKLEEIFRNQKGGDNIIQFKRE